MNRRRTLAMIAVLGGGCAAAVVGAWCVELIRAERASRTASPYATESKFNIFMPDPGNPHGSLVFCQWRDTGRQTWSASRLPIVAEANGRAPHWVDLPAREGNQVRWTYAYGVPFMCMKYEVVQGTDVTGVRISNRAAAAIRVGGKKRGRYHAMLPLRPIWTGLLGNTLVYAGLIYSVPLMIGSGSRVCRGYLRLRRGRCPFCNYDLRGDIAVTCPECGRSALPGTGRPT